MLPIGKDTKLVVVEGHISVGLFESMQGLLTERVMMRQRQDSQNPLPTKFCTQPTAGFNKYTGRG